MKIAPKNWSEFQHYKDRNPTWIKLHKKLLDDYDFQRLPVASRALAPMLWLIASESEDGAIDADYEKLAFRLRMTPSEIDEALGPLIGKGFFTVVAFAEQCASSLLAETERVDSPENIKPTQNPKTLRVVTDTGFGRFWEVWPGSERKVAKAKCAEVWRKRHLERAVDQIVAHVQAMKETDTWKRGFEPAPLTYLNQRRWEDGANPPDKFAGAI